MARDSFRTSILDLPLPCTCHEPFGMRPHQPGTCAIPLPAARHETETPVRTSSESRPEISAVEPKRPLVRIEFDGTSAREAQRFDMARRIREVEQGPDNAIWLVEDGTRGHGLAAAANASQTVGSE